jgi:hypothetical protein
VVNSPASSLILRRWWRLPFWLLAVMTGAKSFVDSPILGSRRLNRLGLHTGRLKAAHGIAGLRRRWLARRLPSQLQEQFDRDGFVAIPDYLPQRDFDLLREQLLNVDLEARSQVQGDTITTRVPIGPELLERVPAVRALLASARWSSILAYVASFSSRPLYYLQSIAAGAADGPPDPQQNLHADTFHPSMKAWLFLSDIDEEGSPLTYVAGSHRLTAKRLAWEKRKSIEVLSSGDRLSQRGSFRISPAELSELGLPQPTRFTVPANTMVVIDTCGFHARGRSSRPTSRFEIWAFCRRSPFLPWTGLDPLAYGPLADRRAQWLAAALDRLDARGITKQHWRPTGSWRDHVASCLAFAPSHNSTSPATGEPAAPARAP